MNLRFFDPTQAYCPDRIDKGLVEGLMLKRASCTIYMVGELETLGTISELAATLAQGKPVIAYVPSFPSYERFRGEYVESVLNKLYPGDDRIKVGLKFLKIMWPNGAWEDTSVRNWLDDGTSVDFDKLVHLIFERAKVARRRKEKDLKRVAPSRSSGQPSNRGCKWGACRAKCSSMCQPVAKSHSEPFDIRHRGKRRCRGSD